MKTAKQIKGAVKDFRRDLECDVCGHKSERVEGIVWALKWVLGR